MADKTGKKQVFDVSHPGTSTPSATSKPIITGSGTMMKDPMFSEDDSKNTESTSEKVDVKVTPSGNRTIQPLETKDAESEETNKEPDAANPIQAPETTTEPIADESSKNESTVKEASKSEDTNNEKEAASDNDKEPENAIVDAVLEQSPDKNNSTKQPAVETEEKYRQLIEAKTYFVKTSSAQSNGLQVVVVLLLLVCAAAAGLYLAHLEGYISVF